MKINKNYDNVQSNNKTAFKFRKYFLNEKNSDKKRQIYLYT